MSDTRSGRATDRVVGAAADENDEAVASWAELADDVAGHVDDFLTALDAVASGGAGAQAVALLLLEVSQVHFCLLYTSDAADEEDSVDLGGRRIIKKKKKKKNKQIYKK